MNKPFELGLIVGRFQTFHLGHGSVFDRALSVCRRVGVFIGSSQESGTQNNPFTYETRRDMLKRVYGDKIEIFPLPDIGVGNTAKWGSYVLDRAFDCFGRLPDLLISGREARRADWLDSERGRKIAELYLPKTVEMSATQMRRYFIEGDAESWKKYTDPALWDCFDALRGEVLASESNRETASI